MLLAGALLVAVAILVEIHSRASAKDHLTDSGLEDAKETAHKEPRVTTLVPNLDF